MLVCMILNDFTLKRQILNYILFFNICNVSLRSQSGNGTCPFGQLGSNSSILAFCTWISFLFLIYLIKKNCLSIKIFLSLHLKHRK